MVYNHRYINKCITHQRIRAQLCHIVVQEDGVVMLRSRNFSVITAGLLFALFFFAGFSSAEELLVFAGAASKPPTEEVAKVFEAKTGVKVYLTFGGSGFVLSQMTLAKKGDIYFPGSSDYMEIAKKKDLVFPETERNVVYLVPAINVQKGNPKGRSP
jgi:molybdate transport system substrate-binding protein